MSFVTSIYGSPNQYKRDELWGELISLSENITQPWALIRDFNAYLSENEKRGGARPNFRSMNQFNTCLTNYQLFDIGFQSPCFIWERKSVKGRIDRCVVNMEWGMAFPEAMLFLSFSYEVGP